MCEKARPHPESDGHVLCPFCETAKDRASTVGWCTGCGARRSTDDAGEVIFDSSRKADRQTLEQAIRAEAGNPSRKDLTGAARRRPVRLGKKGWPAS